MTETKEQRVARQAAAAVREAVGAAYDRRRFAIEKFGRHRDGYLHARVIFDGRPYYISCQFGSWLLPGQINGREVLKEPEALFGSALGRELKFMLSETAQRFERREDDEPAQPTAQS
jgi:hypothetical protein